MHFGHLGATGASQNPEKPMLFSLVPGDTWGDPEAKMGRERSIPVLANLAGLF